MKHYTTTIPAGIYPAMISEAWIADSPEKLCLRLITPAGPIEDSIPFLETYSWKMDAMLESVGIHLGKNKYVQLDPDDLLNRTGRIEVGMKRYNGKAYPFVKWLGGDW